MSMTPIKIGILSAAHYHSEYWSLAFATHPQSQLVGVWDDKPERGAALAAAHNTTFHGELDALLATCDAVGITSETSRHAELVEAAAARGVHVLLEKPMSRNLDEARRIAAAVEGASIAFMLNLPKRYDPINHELIELVSSGALGELSLVRIRHGNHAYLAEDVVGAVGWHADPDLAGGGALIDEGVHATDFLYWLLGLPRSVWAMTTNQVAKVAVEDTALAVYRYDGGVIGEVVTSNVFVGAAGSIELYGSRGAAFLEGVDLASRDLAAAPYLRFVRAGGSSLRWESCETTPRFVEGKQAFHQQGPHRFLEVLAGEAAPDAALHDAWPSLAMVEAAYRSAAERTEVPVPQALRGTNS